MLNDGEFQSEQIGSFFSFAKASDEFGISLIGEARIPKRSAQLCETILRMYEAGTLSFSFEIMASDISEQGGIMVIDAAEGNELIGMAIVSVPAYPEATALQLVAERQEDHEMDETVKKQAETEARLKLAEEKMMDDEEKLRQKDDALEETTEKQKRQEAELAAAQEQLAEKDARIAELEAQVSHLEPFKAEAEKLKAEKEAAELAAKQQELTAFAEAQLSFYHKVRADVNRIVGYSTDAMSITNADKPYANISQTIAELSNRQRMDNPNSVAQMKQWLADHGLEVESLDKKVVKELLKTAPPELAKALELRQQLARSSVKKYIAMENCVCADGRCRGMFQFYGANRSGRWAGRLIQLQNLPQNHIPDLAQARSLVKAGDYAMLRLLYEDVPDTLSQLIRTAFIPKAGFKFIVSDFSAIEARVIAHLAGETWRTEVFRKNGDIYCASASNMFGVPVEKHGVNGHLRQKGKIAELALGYGGSVGALKAMGALDMGLQEDELQPLVSAWRQSNPNIVSFWWDVDDAVKDAIRGRTATETHGIRFIYQSGMLFIALPSGRRLAYVKPKIGENRFGGESVTYEGVGATKKWERIESYGPKFVENIVQAISRDILCYAMRTLSHCFICGHIHDELIIEASEGVDLNAVCEQMSRVPPWLPGAVLRADGYETEWYRKD